MGAQQSTRKLTIDNEDPANVIKVSDSVVERLRGGNEAKPNINRAGGTPPDHTIPVTPTHLPAGAMYPPYMYEPSPTSLQVRQDKENSLRKNDAYWQNRINKLEETHQKINKIMDEEYNDAMKEVKSNFTEIQSGTRPPICVEGKRAVLECYRKNPKEPMRCAKAVQDFADCVDKHRSAIVANRG